VRSLVYRLQIRNWHGHRAHTGAGLTAAQDEAGRHRSDEPSPSSRSAAVDGARTASQLAPHSPAPDSAWQFASEAQFSRSAVCCYRAQGGTIAAVSALLQLATVAASVRLGPRALATGRAGRFRGRGGACAQGRRFSLRRVHEQGRGRGPGGGQFCQN
jgi:hypothetical protein